jgi:nucleoside-diphosphate-sugar epimerase
VPELLQRAWSAPAGGELEVFSPDHMRTFCYVDDAVELIRRLAEAEAGRNQTFNVGVETKETTIRELAEIVIRVVGKPLEIKPGPTTPGSPARRCPEMARTVAVARYQPAVELEDGVRRTYEWYREQVFEPAAASPTRGNTLRRPAGPG